MKFLNNIKRIFGFNININSIIKEEKNNFQIFANQTIEKHRSWEDKQKLIKSIFNDVIKQTKNSIIELSKHESLNQIQLSFGMQKLESSINEKNSMIENGSALVFSKACNGFIICSIYYAHSKEHTPKESYFIWKLYKNPKDISKKEIYKAVSLLFTVQRVSSALYGYDFFDLSQIWICKFKSFCSLHFITVSKKMIEIVNDTFCK